ncbi:hypothetical protein IEQ34_020309 [Dendrobium chrysotoxum]|uniref:Uncharacterized protein n=1 Tax=Dendrobium chrysotoxum TaxID=161865 RepID=A0AAV7G1P9_DENCH|nr:hypothetical protein IEQ34_020309 [Dendrobium chrysotoxum]
MRMVWSAERAERRVRRGEDMRVCSWRGKNVLTKVRAIMAEAATEEAMVRKLRDVAFAFVWDSISTIFSPLKILNAEGKKRFDQT